MLTTFVAQCLFNPTSVFPQGNRTYFSFTAALAGLLFNACQYNLVGSLGSEILRHDHYSR